MKKDIILSGVGGQGILSIATVIGKVFLRNLCSYLYPLLIRQGIRLIIFTCKQKYTA